MTKRKVERLEIGGGWERIRWPDERSGPWSIAGYWVEVEGRRECVGLEFWKGCEPTDTEAVMSLAGGPQPIGTLDLRKLPVSSIVGALWDRQIAAAREQATLAAERVTDEGPPEDLLEWWEAERAHHEMGLQGKPTRRRRDRNLLERVADIYDQANRARRPPTKAVAEELFVSSSTATKYVSRARAEGLLPPAASGRPSPVRNKRKGKKR